MSQINPSTKLIIFQFKVSNMKTIPDSLRGLGRPPTEEAKHQGGQKGELVIAQTEDCGLMGIAGQLAKAGYELANCFWEERELSYVVRFLFFPRESLEPEGFEEHQKAILSGFAELCEGAIWQVAGYRNPFFKNGNAVTGKHVLCFTCGSRKPLLQPDGNPVVVWDKDEEGRRVGAAPRPLEASHVLQLKGAV